MSELLSFNVQDGFLEAVVRGFRSSILTQADYANLSQCDNVDDMKMHLSVTEYGPFLQNEPSPLATTVLGERCTEKLVEEFNYIRCHANENLAKFLDFITFQYMIDNVILIITGTLHDRDTEELMEKCHPLGMFDSLKALCVASNAKDLFQTVLVDTPLAQYFSGCLSVEDLDELNIEIIRSTLYKAYLEDFNGYCQSLGGSTAEVMGQLLQFEADRRSINITLNSFNTDLSKDDRARLYPNYGGLYPEGIERLKRADDFDAVRSAAECDAVMNSVFTDASFGADKSLEDSFFEKEVKMCCLAFEQQFHFGVFFCYLKLKEQEIRNIVWIAECIAQDQKSRINQYIPIFN